MLDSKTITTTWARLYCDRCHDRTVFVLVKETTVKCTQCSLEKDMSLGLDRERVLPPA